MAYETCGCLCPKHDKDHLTKVVITEEMAKNHFIKDDFGHTIFLNGSIGYITKSDVGRTLYVRHGHVTMSISKQGGKKVHIV